MKNNPKRPLASLFVAGTGMIIGLCLSVSSCQHGRHLHAKGGDRVSFEREIKPLFATNCVKCHNGTGTSERGGKAPDFRTRKSALAEYAAGYLIVPGSSADSRLFTMVKSSDYGTMPPSGHSLTKQQVETIKKWIDQGAHWPRGKRGVIVPVF